jgi:hypothetical protein
VLIETSPGDNVKANIQDNKENIPLDAIFQHPLHGGR